MQAHADREGEVLHQRQQLPRGVVALQHGRPRGAQHLRDDRMAVLDVQHPGLHRHEHDVGVVAIDHEVGDVGQQLVIGVLADLGRRGAGLAHRYPDQLPAAVQALALERILGSGSGSSSSAGSAVTTISRCTPISSRTWRAPRSRTVTTAARVSASRTSAAPRGRAAGRR